MVFRVIHRSYFYCVWRLPKPVRSITCFSGNVSHDVYSRIQPTSTPSKPTSGLSPIRALGKKIPDSATMSRTAVFLRRRSRVLNTWCRSLRCGNLDRSIFKLQLVRRATCLYQTLSHTDGRLPAIKTKMPSKHRDDNFRSTISST